jgi:hypothetical protein
VIDAQTSLFLQRAHCLHDAPPSIATSARTVSL